MVMRIRHATTEHMVIHFMREISYRKCMKNPIISAALISYKPIRIVSIFAGAMF